MIDDGFKMLGLTENEKQVYLCVLKAGTCRGTQIRRAIGIANSQVYAALDALISQGLINYAKHARGKIYSALDPDSLKSVTVERMKQIEQMILLLKSMQSVDKLTTDTAVFEGFNGFKSAMVQMAKDCPVGETVCIIGFSTQAYKNAKLAAVLRDVNKISAARKHKFRMLLDDMDNPFYNQRKAERLSEIRFMGKGFVSPTAIDIYQDNVYVLLWDEVPYVFYIRNATIARGFKAYFDFLWAHARM
jgi:sugar-specific transcriptional regulator TrmB